MGGGGGIPTAPLCSAAAESALVSRSPSGSLLSAVFDVTATVIAVIRRFSLSPNLSSCAESPLRESRGKPLFLPQGPIIKVKYEPNMKEAIGMVCGGTGITPMLQVVEGILSNPADKTKVSLVFANNEERDILLKDRLDALAKKHPNFKARATDGE